MQTKPNIYALYSKFLGGNNYIVFVVSPREKVNFVKYEARRIDFVSSVNKLGGKTKGTHVRFVFIIWW